MPAALIHVVSATGKRHPARLHPAGLVAACGLVSDSVPVIVNARFWGETPFSHHGCVGALQVADWLRGKGYRNVRVEE